MVYRQKMQQHHQQQQHPFLHAMDIHVVWVDRPVRQQTPKPTAYHFLELYSTAFRLFRSHQIIRRKLPQKIAEEICRKLCTCMDYQVYDRQDVRKGEDYSCDDKSDDWLD